MYELKALLVAYQLMGGRVAFYWYERTAGEEVGTAWGQLAGAAHRLRFVCEEFENCTSDPNVNVVLLWLAYHMENYLVRIYELRERIVALAALIVGSRSIAGLLKSKRQRPAALQTLESVDAVLAQTLDGLLSSLDSDIALRNQHTHDTFLSVGICTDHDIYDPEDALIDLSSDPEAQTELSNFLRTEVQRVADEYAEKGNAVIEATLRFLKAADRK